MAEIAPFSCFRPARALVNRFVQKPSDFPPEQRDHLEKLLNKSVYSISQPDLFGKTFEDGKQKFSELFKNGFIFPELNKAFYIYQIEEAGQLTVGVVITQHINDFLNGTIKIHEKTRKTTRTYLRERFLQLRLNFTPIFSFYKNNTELTEKIHSWRTENPDLSFNTADGRKHSIWKLDQGHQIDTLVTAFEQIDAIYLADGHHRLNMFLEVCNELELPEAKRWVPNIIFPASDMKILAFARLIRDIPPMLMNDLSKLLAEKFDISEPTEETSAWAYDIYMNGSWKRYALLPELRKKYSDTGIAYLEALNTEVLESIFNIQDQRSDERILFFKDFKDKSELERSVNKTHSDLAIQLHPIDVHDIILAAETQLELPPKSSLFEPKPRAGVFITQI
ncbi:MAG: DUF1015 family protein [Saprospiraceae bacterium]|nr:DUF1015 family protein [Saprospiraceae bacterium]